MAAGEDVHYMAPGALAVRALAALARGDTRGAKADSGRGLDVARELGDRQVIAPAVAARARVLAELGPTDEARALVDRGAELLTAADPCLASLAIVLAELGRDDRLLAGAPASTRWVAAARSGLQGDWRVAADTYARMGWRTDEADARLRAASTLAAEGRRAEAEEELRLALAFYRAVGATRYAGHAESLLARTA